MFYRRWCDSQRTRHRPTRRARRSRGGCSGRLGPDVAGSGITAENIGRLSEVDAFIVGSSIKQDGLWSNPIDLDRLNELVRAFQRDAT